MLDSNFLLSFPVFAIGFSMKNFQPKNATPSQKPMMMNQLSACTHPNSGPAHVVI
jgi:hypothetical protein